MDIAPQLLKDIQKHFNGQYAYSEDLTELLLDIESGKVTSYKDAQRYADIIGEILGNAYEVTLKNADLPNDRLYENICEKVIKPTLENNYNLVNDVSGKIQLNINKVEGVGLKVQYPDIDSDDLNRIIHEAANSTTFDSKALNRLKQNTKTFSVHTVDRFIQKNASFQFKAGMSAKIIRKTDGKCCEWCSNLAGTYNYPDVPEDVYKRHNNCRCTVEYYPGKGKRLQNVHNQNNWRQVEDGETIELRKNIGIDNSKVKNVTKEYVRRATPGKGDIKKAANFISKGAENETERANWLLKTFGGDITLNEFKETKYADYWWNGKLWDLKTLSSSKYNTIDQHVRDCSKQIQDGSIRGGMIADITNNKLSIKEMRDEISQSFKNRHLESMDVLIKKNDKYEIFRLTKEE